MKRRNFWKLLPMVCFVPAILAKIKPRPEHHSSGILNFINEGDDHLTFDWSKGMNEKDFDDLFCQVFKHSDITAEWCRKSGFHVEQDENGQYYIQNQFGRLYLLR